jgi:arginase
MHIEVLGAPLDLGADRPGVDLGPIAIRYAGLGERLRAQGHTVSDLGDLPHPIPGRIPSGTDHAKYLSQIVAMAASIRDSVRAVALRGHLPLVLGGDHSVSLGSVAGVSASHQPGVIWMDAHADFNTPETTPSGNVHGMVLASLAGFGHDLATHIGEHLPVTPPDLIAIVGARELDQGEKDRIRATGVHVYTMAEIDDRGVSAVMASALDAVGSENRRIHLSLDIDVVDPAIAPGVGTPVPGGLSYREAQLAVELISANGHLASMDVVEVNPILDRFNETAILAVELVLSAMGKRIL